MDRLNKIEKLIADRNARKDRAEKLAIKQVSARTAKEFKRDFGIEPDSVLVRRSNDMPFSYGGKYIGIPVIGDLRIVYTIGACEYYLSGILNKNDEFVRLSYDELLALTAQELRNIANKCSHNEYTKNYSRKD